MSYDPSKYDGVVCTIAELNLQNATQPHPPIHCLTRGQTIGLTMNTVASTVSLLAVLTVFVLIIRNYVQHLLRPPSSNWRLIQRPMDLYMLSLFSFNLLQAVGTTLDVKWLRDGKLENGPYCTAQGTIQQLGETGVALTTLAITMHTFSTIWWRKGGHSLRTASFVIGTSWLFIALYVGIGAGVNRGGGYETPTPYWCWIGSRYIKEEISGEYFWFWLTLVTSIVAYILLYFWSRGSISPHPERWWMVKFSSVTSADGQEPYNRRRGRLVMLVYPVVYCVTVLPLSVVRWIAFVKGNSHITSQATFTVNFIFELTGFLDVLLFFLTRTGLLLFGGSSPATDVGQTLLPTPTQSIKGRPRTNSDVSMQQVTPSGDRAARLPAVGRLPDDDDDGWSLGQMNRRSIQ